MGFRMAPIIQTATPMANKDSSWHIVALFKRTITVPFWTTNSRQCQWMRASRLVNWLTAWKGLRLVNCLKSLQKISDSNHWATLTMAGCKAAQLTKCRLQQVPPFWTPNQQWHLVSASQQCRCAWFSQFYANFLSHRSIPCQCLRAIVPWVFCPPVPNQSHHHCRQRSTLWWWPNLQWPRRMNWRSSRQRCGKILKF